MSNLRLLQLTFAFAVSAGALLPGPGITEAEANFSPQVIACRASIAKSSLKLSKSLLRIVNACHSARDRDAALSSVDCNDFDTADLGTDRASAEAKFRAVVSTGSKCAGVSPNDAGYTMCPAPCAAAVPSMTTMTNVADCLICLGEARIEALSESIHGTPNSPLSSDERRCDVTVGTSGGKLFQTAVKDIQRCQAREESAGATGDVFCTETIFPSDYVEEASFKAQGKIAESCMLSSFANLDSCASGATEIAECTAAQVLAAASGYASDISSPAPTTTTTTTTTLPTTTTTTTSTTTTTIPFVQDPQCPNNAELVLLSHDSNIACNTNADCPAPRTCDTTSNICVSKSDLDSGWTGHAHNSDLDEGVVQRSYLNCAGPAPTCGECLIGGIDPTPGNCRCSNNTRNICDEPFEADADDCGGATCDCYFGVPIPLSSAGTPACIVNRYNEDISGTANVDTGSSSISATLRTKVYLGITTTNPCPVCGGKCSNNPATACVRDADCGAGTCNQDVPKDGVRNGICIDGENHGASCDVGGINPSFPAHPGGFEGGGGYSLDCFPSVGINISGAGLALDVTQTTGTSQLDATLPCTGGECHCKTCSADPQEPCNTSSDCSGGSCAISASLSCNSNSDCSNVSLGICTTIDRCSLATSVRCETDADCQNQNGGNCNPSSCTAIGAQGTAPKPNGCTAGACTDLGNGDGMCTTGPDDKTCDGLVRANGKGILSCANNDDCTANSELNGTCSLTQRRSCFLDPIVAQGEASTEFPVGVATFCVPPTSNGSINQVAGLPGPARVVNQGASTAFCASDPNVEYQAGIGGCP